MPDTVLANRYKLVAKLGAGAMGSVWRADDLTLQRQVAIKLIKPAYGGIDGSAGAVSREARAAARLSNTHIITIHDYGIDNDSPFIVMELLEGEPFGGLRRDGALSPAMTANLLSQVGDALVYGPWQWRDSSRPEARQYLHRSETRKSSKSSIPSAQISSLGLTSELPSICSGLM